MSARRLAAGWRARARRVVAAVVVACLLLAGPRRLALAHATLVRAEPAAGSRLASGPARVRLEFNEAIEAGLARLTLVGPDGRAIRLAARGDPHDVDAVVAPVPPLGAGGYRLAWRVVSADGHAVEGALAFAVAGGAGTAAPPPAASPNAAPEPAPEAAPRAVPNVGARGDALGVAGAPLVPAALRGLALGSVMALAGVLGFLALPCGAGAPPPRRPLRLAGALAVAAPLFLALHAAAWLAQIAPDGRLTTAWAAAGLASGPGRVELWRTGLALLALWALGLARRPGLALAFALGALAVSGAAGHPAAIHPAWAIPSKALHLAAAAAWLGGVLWLLARERTDARAFAREAGRVSAVALPAALLVTLSGAAQAALFLPAPAALVASAYGAITLLKVAGLLVLVAFGAYYRRRVLPRLADEPAGAGRFGGLLRREAAVMGLVTLLGGLLAYVPPPAAAPAAGGANSSHASVP